MLAYKKHLSLICLIISLCVLEAQAQDADDVTPKRKKGLIGFHGGITSTTLSGTEVDLQTNSPGEYQESQTGVDVALDYKFEAATFFYIRTGAGLITKNAQFYNSFVYPIKANLKFFNIPLMVGLQSPSTAPVILGVEGGLIANIDAGSTTANAAGLHPDNKVVQEKFVPSSVIGFNLEAKIGSNVRVFANYRMINDLDDYYKRTYTVYDPTGNGNNTEYHYNFRISSNSLTVGVLFVPKK